ncbi:MAG: hypothetical protein HC888_17525 [Candidatus Competibacteraceae bacterium]|nr:hypothetical protein [Candidatus Competibacteraceae bacterium]
MSGMTGLPDEERQQSHFLGASAAFGPASGDITFQTSWTDAYSTFSDINGDGFVDFVRKGEPGFALNDRGSSFVSTPWGFADEVASPTGIDGAEEESFRRQYLHRRTARRWKSYRSGRIEVRESAALDPGASGDGIVLSTYGPGATLSLALNAGDERSGSAGHVVAKGESLYFHGDVGDDERGDEATWNVRISYQTVRQWEDMGTVVSSHPITRSENSLPYGDGRFDPIYLRDSGYDSDTGTYYDYYLLRANWQSLTGPDVYRALIDHGRFVPERIPRSVFSRMYNAGLSRRLVDGGGLGGVDPDYNNQATLLSWAYAYEAETDSFQITDWSAVFDRRALRSGVVRGTDRGRSSERHGVRRRMPKHGAVPVDGRKPAPARERGGRRLRDHPDRGAGDDGAGPSMRS